MESCRQFKINILDDTNKLCKDCKQSRSKHKSMPRTLGTIQSQKQLQTQCSLKIQDNGSSNVKPQEGNKACFKFMVSLKEDPQHCNRCGFKKNDHKTSTMFLKDEPDDLYMSQQHVTTPHQSGIQQRISMFHQHSQNFNTIKKNEVVQQEIAETVQASELDISVRPPQRPNLKMDKLEISFQQTENSEGREGDTTQFKKSYKYQDKRSSCVQIEHKLEKRLSCAQPEKYSIDCLSDKQKSLEQASPQDLLAEFQQKQQQQMESFKKQQEEEMQKVLDQTVVEKRSSTKRSSILNAVNKLKGAKEMFNQKTRLNQEELDRVKEQLEGNHEKVTNDINTRVQDTVISSQGTQGKLNDGLLEAFNKYKKQQENEKRQKKKWKRKEQEKREQEQIEISEKEKMQSQADTFHQNMKELARYKDQLQEQEKTFNFEPCDKNLKRLQIELDSVQREEIGEEEECWEGVLKSLEELSQQLIKI